VIGAWPAGLQRDGGFDDADGAAAHFDRFENAVAVA
jgi:hypothetical protein